MQADSLPSARLAQSDRPFYAVNALVSAGAVLFLGYVLLLREASPAGQVDLRFLPAVNASLNALSAVLLAAGWIAIRRRAVRVHRTLMISAFVASALFFACYVLYHWTHGDTRYQGEGLLRTVYLFVLISHVVLSITVLPAALTAFYLAWRRQFVRHRRLMRVALPIWLYVSVTGVLIYFLLRAGGGVVAA